MFSKELQERYSISARSATDLSLHTERVIKSLRALAEYVRPNLHSFVGQVVLVTGLGANSWKGARINVMLGQDEVSLTIGANVVKANDVDSFNCNSSDLI